MNKPPLVSIIINNHNYARYVGDAIKSALAQTYRPVEVIVVDDGSTDDSRAVIRGYAGQVIPVFQPAAGQAAAFNSGLARSGGEVVIFLDADDALCPGLAAEVVAVFQADPHTAKVHYRLAVIDAQGQPTGAMMPAWHKPLPSGDLLSHLRQFCDDIAWQPTSGNAFSASVLRRFFPVPEHEYGLCADYYLSNLAPLFGPVRALEGVGGFYRVHGANRHHATTMNLERTRTIIEQTCHTHRHLARVAAALGLRGFLTDSTAVPALSFLAHRLVSVRLDPARHPIAADTAWSLGRRGMWAAWGRFDLSWLARAIRAAWFAAALVAPRPAVGWLAQRFFYP